MILREEGSGTRQTVNEYMEKLKIKPENKMVIGNNEAIKKIETPKKVSVENKEEEIKEEKIEETTTQVENKTKIEENQKEILEEKNKAVEKKKN